MVGTHATTVRTRTSTVAFAAGECLVVAHMIDVESFGDHSVEQLVEDAVRGAGYPAARPRCARSATVSSRYGRTLRESSANGLAVVVMVR